MASTAGKDVRIEVEVPYPDGSSSMTRSYHPAWSPESLPEPKRMQRVAELRVVVPKLKEALGLLAHMQQECLLGPAEVELVQHLGEWVRALTHELECQPREDHRP